MQTSSVCKTRNRPVMKARNPETGYVILFRPRCKMWSCPTCAEINQKLWAVRSHSGAEQLIETGRELQFLTLTSNEKLGPDGTLYVWPRAWKKLHARANREAGKSAYMMVPERHSDGRLHMHAISTWGLGSRWWKDNSRECGLGYMAEEKEVNSPVGAACYVVKYISKQLALAQWPRGFRHVRTSRDWPKLPELEKPDGWSFSVLEKEDNLMKEIIRHTFFFDKVLMLDHRAAWQAIAAISADGELVD